MIHNQSSKVAKTLPHTFDTNAPRETSAWTRVLSMALTTLLILSVNLVASAKPPQIRRNHAPIRLPMVEGNGIRFTHFSTEQGLSQSRVDHILEDKQGFLRFGTYNGLNRYDGYRCILDINNELLNFQLFGKINDSKVPAVLLTP
jgi:hypothetical protein